MRIQPSPVNGVGRPSLTTEVVIEVTTQENRLKRPRRWRQRAGYMNAHRTLADSEQYPCDEQSHGFEAFKTALTAGKSSP